MVKLRLVEPVSRVRFSLAAQSINSMYVRKSAPSESTEPLGLLFLWVEKEFLFPARKKLAHGTRR